MKLLNTLLLAFFLVSVAWSQDVEEAADTDSQDTEVVDAAESDDDKELDEPGYEKEDDDDFIPSQEVSADQTLPFPVDI